MVNVLITVKKSERFPGKNRLLAPYTIVWLLNEIAYLDVPVRVYTVGERAQLPIRLPVGWKHIRTSGNGHQADVAQAEKEIAPTEGDVMVLIQVTQPLREHGLLEKAIQTINRGATSCVSVTELQSDSWRNVCHDGRWRHKECVSRHVVDGKLYAWQPGHSEDIFKTDAPHSLIQTTQRWGYVDIDTAADIPPGLEAMAAALLLKPVGQPPLILRGRKVLLIGSGIDLVGRNLGTRIDDGEWDVVVRCNHYYGSPSDVGTRTDLAVVREARFELDFFEEAPQAPLRVISTNDGNNFPKSILHRAAQEVGHKEASIGVIAGLWLLSMGAKLSVIGIGHFVDGTWIKQKTYPNGKPDFSNFCDWNKEKVWWMRQKNVELL